MTPVPPRVIPALATTSELRLLSVGFRARKAAGTYTSLCASRVRDDLRSAFTFRCLSLVGRVEGGRRRKGIGDVEFASGVVGKSSRVEAVRR